PPCAPPFPYTTLFRSLGSRPLGFALREESGDALPEVGARVAHLDEIAILAGREAALRRETANHFLGRQDRQRRIRRNLQGKFAQDRKSTRLNSSHVSI